MFSCSLIANRDLPGSFASIYINGCMDAMDYVASNLEMLEVVKLWAEPAIQRVYVM